MTMSPDSMLLLGLILTLILAAISIFVSRSPGTAADGPHALTRFFLVALRLSIGWHFFVEGMDKLNSASWTSEPYLREASGPLAPYFREIAGDRLVDKLTLGQNGSFPAELDIEWQAYLDGLTRFYDLDAAQSKQAAAVFEQAKTNALAWLKDTAKPVQKISEYPPPLVVPMTIPERLKEYESLQAKVWEIETNLLPKYGADAFAKLKSAKANVNKWRSELKSDLDSQTTALKQALRDKVLVGIAIRALPKEYQVKAKEAKEPAVALQTIYHQLLLEKAPGEGVKLPPQAELVFEYAIDKKKDKQDPNELLPAPTGLRAAARPVGAWSMLDWSDFFVKWGITLTGVFLLAGLLTRTACVVGAGLLLMFFLAMPPLPGWPESPRAEGHYLFVNKNIVEMLALLTLATTRSGRWAGLDGLLQFLRPRRWQDAPPSSTLERVVRLEEEPTLAIDPMTKDEARMTKE
jgi:uncharacterized membrane protein YphA (DoxX/SURF4 family)